MCPTGYMQSHLALFSKNSFGQIFAPEKVVCQFIGYCFHPWCPDGLVGVQQKKFVSQKP